MLPREDPRFFLINASDIEVSGCPCGPEQAVQSKAPWLALHDDSGQPCGDWAVFAAGGLLRLRAQLLYITAKADIVKVGAAAD